MNKGRRGNRSAESLAGEKLMRENKHEVIGLYVWIGLILLGCVIVIFSR